MNRIFILLAVLGAFFSPNPFLFIFSLGLLWLLYKWFWRDNEPKSLLINLFLYWLVVAILLFYGLLFNLDVTTLFRYGRSPIDQAILLGLIAFAFYLVGAYLPIRKLRLQSLTELTSVLSRYDAQKLFTGYLFYSIAYQFINSVFLGFAGGQFLLPFLYLKWAFLIFLIIHTLLYPSETKYVVVLIVAEILLSFSGFWASFKDYILVALSAFLTLNLRLSFKNYISIFLISVSTFIVASIWSFSKGEYRFYLTGGQRSQAIVQTDEIENIQKLWEIVSDDFSAENFWENLKVGSVNLVYRISYVEFLGLTIRNVPTYIPHEDGNLLKGAIEHILKPRILFPEKKAIFDSELTSKYTGVQFAGAEQGTSFSLGTVAESYVDFGPIYMFVPIFFFGLWVGWIYRYFVLNSFNLVWGLCYSAPIFNFAWSFPVPTTKFFGWSIMYFVGFYLINRFLIKYVDYWLLKKEFKV